MTKLIEFKWTRSGIAHIGKRQLQGVGRAAIGEAGALWWKKYLRLHFMNTGRWRYNYEPRGFKYNKRKRERDIIGGVRSLGENKPLVWSGRTRESATRTKTIETVARNYKNYEARVIMPAPALNFQPVLREELTRLHPQEIKMMEKEFAAEFERQLNNLGHTNKKTKTYRAAA